nr:MAG TPA: hypothetical protein [Caudoviricetes sp.]
MQQLLPGILYIQTMQNLWKTLKVGHCLVV